MTNWLLGIVLGIVQGVSEWLPISSKTQVIIASTYLFGLNFNEAYAIGLFLEAGTFVAAAYYFRHEVWRVLLALVGKGDEEGRLLLKFLVVVTAFTALVGVAIYTTVQSVSGPALGLPMILLGCVLIGDGLLITYAKGKYVPTKGLRDLSLKELVLVGIVQGVSALPGVSRSGITVSVMLLLGINPKDSFKLSFLALIPASIGAAGVTVLFSHVSVTNAIGAITPQVILLAIFVSVLIGVAFIGLLLRAAGSQRIALLTISLGILALASGIVSIATGISG
ncbi:MAG: undecaprenyl-diphosphatase [Nitrososphaerota archaeon]|jgi:undecaprenyl-diphosphatase|nr:undecaprenyl-diphosphatase [Nitrososphaerota archaeon]MDG6959868.1 undecaprenyl-diphosphatase [Nitrososphaerota archaeon]MDG6981685.1 undecaprenyl-diphosphatase [Nitrososphaerota archaeon]MDG7015096.1 undecaprenyl-diphosphatase [Nitrososphaerota archaeon]WGO49875.1 MAG: undecaprenyl-diphosphatase [Nitrososphaerota archaeon]